MFEQTNKILKETFTAETLFLSKIMAYLKSSCGLDYLVLTVQSCWTQVHKCHLPSYN